MAENEGNNDIQQRPPTEGHSISEFEGELFKNGTFKFEVSPQEAEGHIKAFNTYKTQILTAEAEKSNLSPEERKRYFDLAEAYKLYSKRAFESPGSRGYDEDIKGKAEAYMQLQKDQVEAQEALMNAWCSEFSGKIPENWAVNKDNAMRNPAMNIINDMRRAAENDVQLSPTLLDAAVTYPDVGIAFQVATYQKLNPFQLSFALAIVSPNLNLERENKNRERIIDAQRDIGASEAVILEAQKIIQNARPAKPNIQ